MRAMRRRAIALCSALSLIAAAFAAPMTHVHDGDGHGGHHRRALVHAHEAIHAHAAAPRHDGPVFDDADHDGAGRVRAFDPFQLVPAFARAVIAMPPAVAVAPAPAVRVVRVRRLVQHGHDPPFVHLAPSRAPPFPLS
jgi:hypothetical protein